MHGVRLRKDLSPLEILPRSSGLILFFNAQIILNFFDIKTTKSQQKSHLHWRVVHVNVIYNAGSRRAAYLIQAAKSSVFAIFITLLPCPDVYDYIE